MRVAILFHGTARYPGCRFLKPGFLHCDMALETSHGWVGLAGDFWGLWVRPLPFDLDPIEWAESEGLPHVVMHRSDAPILLGRRLLTCVQAIKAVVGIRDWRVQTPWQLWKALNGRCVQQAEGSGAGRASEAA